jgi:hypothetical protein
LKLLGSGGVFVSSRGSTRRCCIEAHAVAPVDADSALVVDEQQAPERGT